MKVLYVTLIAVLLAGCGPSAEQMTATAVLAQAQTQTAAPTLTFTPTSTPTSTPTQMPTPTLTATPIFTSTPTFSESIVVIPHSAPTEKTPRGLPPAAVSKYLKTTSGGFNAQIPEDGKPWSASFSILLEVQQDIPSEARIEVHFENPLDPTSAIVTQLDGPFINSIYIASLPLAGIECKTYWVEIHIYSDATMTTELGSHLQWLQSTFNTNKMADIMDLLSNNSCNR